jgi:hypothetical protein
MVGKCTVVGGGGGNDGEGVANDDGDDDDTIVRTLPELEVRARRGNIVLFARRIPRCGCCCR